MRDTLYFLSQIRYLLAEDAIKKLLVHSLVSSRPDYCSVVWRGLGKTDIVRMQKMVNFTAQVIHGTRMFDHEHIN